MKIILSIVSTILFLTAPTVQASNLLLEAGIHAGGDELVNVTFVGGMEQSMKAGGLISLSVGLISEIDETLELRTTLGYKFDSITMENGDLDFSRYPITAMLFNKGEKFSMGIGTTYHLNPKFKSSGFAGNFTVDFDNAIGFIAEVDYKLNERAYVGIQLTTIDYEVNTTLGSDKVNGNSFGVVTGARF